MIWQEILIVVAGFIGASVAVIHGVLVRKKISAPLASVLADERTYPAAISRLVPVLLDFSGYNWLIGGIALMAAPFVLGAEAIQVTALLVGSSYLFAAIGNFWGTRGRHPGWALYALALALLAAGLLLPQG